MINVVGLGYIGLPTALMLSTSGIEVTGTDINSELINDLLSGNINFTEKEINEKYIEAVNKGIKFSYQYICADTYIIAVPTPYNKNKKIDLRFVINAVKSILRICPDNAVIIIESTISPGTIENHILPLAKNINKTVRFAYAPERIIPGNTISELVENARIIGVSDKETGEYIKNIYSHFVKGEIKITDLRTAEIVKLTENSFRAVNIAFANELAQICNEEKANVNEIIQLCNMHPRVNILKPGPGVGGHCIPIDPWFLIKNKKRSVIKEALLKNESMPKHIFKRIKKIMKENHIKNMNKVGLYGIAYKENVNDYRNSPTLQLLKIEPNFITYDYMISKKIVRNQKTDLIDFLNSVDMVVIMTGHDEIKQNQELFKNKIIFDTRNICNLPGIYKL